MFGEVIVFGLFEMIQKKKEKKRKKKESEDRVPGVWVRPPGRVGYGGASRHK